MAIQVTVGKTCAIYSHRHQLKNDAAGDARKHSRHSNVTDIQTYIMNSDAHCTYGCRHTYISRQTQLPLRSQCVTYFADCLALTPSYLARLCDRGSLADRSSSPDLNLPFCWVSRSAPNFCDNWLPKKRSSSPAAPPLSICSIYACGHISKSHCTT